MTIRVTGPGDRAPLPDGTTTVNVTSRSPDLLWRQLSPFFLGPCQLYWGLAAKNVENAWQYSKVYDDDRAPTHILPGWGDSPKFHDCVIEEGWFKWALQGFNQDRAQRYPIGKGAKPLFSYWAGQRLNYLEARKLIYVPLYALAAVKTEAYSKLFELFNAGVELALWDFDGYQGPRTFSDVLNNLNRPMGHAFVLRAMLEEPETIGNLVAVHRGTL